MTAVTALPAHAAVACSVTYAKQWDNGSGFGAALNLTNTGDPLTSWAISFSFPGNQQITQPPWNAGPFTQTGQNVVINNATWNGSVPTGGSVTNVGFNGSYSGQNVDPTSFSVNGVSCGGQQQTPQLVVTPTAVSVPEGATATYRVHLTSAPAANVPVTSTAAATGDTNITVSAGATLTFTPANFATDQTVTLAAAEDADTVNGTRNITVSSTTAGINPVTVVATENDNDVAQQALVVTPTSLNVPEGGNATYNVRPQVALTGTATITVTNTLAATGDTSITLQAGSPSTITLNAANSAAGVNVTVLAAEDADTTAGTRTITVSAPGLTSVVVTATEVDNDVANQALVVSPTTLPVPEGASATYNVKPMVALTGTATITVTNTLAATGDANLTLQAGSPSTITLNAANSAAGVNVTVLAAEDADTVNGSRAITVSAPGLTSVTVTANEVDNDQATQTIVVSTAAVTVPEGSTAQFGVHLSQPVATGQSVVVTTTAAAGGDANLTVSAGASLTFTSANSNVDQMVTLAAAEDADTTPGTRNFTVASTTAGIASVTVVGTEQDNDGTTNVYLTEFMTQYNKLKTSGTTGAYFSPEGVPYHGIETLIVEAPDHGHETTSEAFSYYIWLEAQFGRATGDWTRFNAAWNAAEQFIIPSSQFQTMAYNATDPADYAPEFAQPSGYPAPLDANIDTGNDPLSAELQQTYGNAAIYGMHWLLDVDNVYGYGQAVSQTAFCHDSTPRVVFINTFQRGPQESTWETVAHPSCETFAWGQQNNGGFAPLFIAGTASQQWRFTDAPDADARAIQATYWALQWATAQGNQSAITASVQKAAKMGDYLRYSFYDKYFKTLGCAATTCATTTGKTGSTGLLAWYFAWGGASDNSWSWRIGASHNHGGYQNELAAWALSTAGPAALRPLSPTAGADWSGSLTRQLQFITWLQSNEGAIAGGATNSWNGNYSARPAGVPQFFGMTYDVAPVYLDPPSNQWFGFQAWGVERLAEYYFVTGDANAKAILDKWVAWALLPTSTTLGTGSSYQIPSTLGWTGTPAASFSSATGMPPANPGLHVTVVDRTQDVGVAAAFVKLLTYYAARAGATSGLGLQAHDTAKGLLDRMLMLKEPLGITIAEQRTDYNRFDDIWSATNSQGLFIPPGYSGVMPNGDTITPGKSFGGIRTFYNSDPNWPQTAAYMAGTGPAPTFTFHRFWAQADIAMALADFGNLFPNG